MHNLLEYLEQALPMDAVAVHAADGTMTRGRWREGALRIAGAIRRRGYTGTGRRIALYLPKGAGALRAMLGVLYAGHAYVPIDTRAPLARTAAILEVLEPALIITDAAGKAALAALEGPLAQLAIEEADTLDGETLAAGEGEALVAETLAATQSEDPAYLLFTSGSTGVPKGVVVPHRRVLHYIQWARDTFDVGADAVIGNQAAFYFTVSAMDIYLSLATGARLHIIPEDLFAKGEKLLAYVEEHHINLVFWVSSVYHNVARTGILANGAPACLQKLWFVGEPMPAHSLERWMEQLPDAEFVNLYGSTETDMTLHYRVPHGPLPAEGVPLGRPNTDTGVLLVDEALRPVPQGETGELCVCGACLALGYFRNPQRTEAAFIQSPLHTDYPDRWYRTGDLAHCEGGLYYFHGRRDHQFKHLGYRIEAGDIEAAAERCAGVRAAAVVYDAEKRQIALFYEHQEGFEETALRRWLMAELPLYMVPTRYVRLQTMPLNANRKKDRVLLKKTYINGEGNP